MLETVKEQLIICGFFILLANILAIFFGLATSVGNKEVICTLGPHSLVGAIIFPGQYVGCELGKPRW